MSGSLEGVRVVDLTRGVAGPYTSKFLADQGADVLKLEPPSGDPSRAFGPFPNDEPHPERSGLFLHLNRNKRAAVVDPASAEGAERIRFLAAQAHIVLEDYAPGSAEAWGWGWKTLHAANPALVMTSMTPFGQTGPYRDYRGSELTLQAIGGPLYTNGHEDREPLKLAGHYAHYHAGIVAALATLMALRRAEAIGAGDWVDISLYECQAGCRDRQSTNLTIAVYTGLSVGRLGSAVFRMGSGVRSCRDGYVNIMGANNRLPRLLRLIGREDLLEHPDIASPAGTEPDELVEAVEGAYAEWLGKMTKREAVAEAQAGGLLAGALYTVADVLQDDHFEVRGVWDTVAHPETGPLRYPGRPFILHSSPRREPQRAPLLNEHTDAIEAGWPSAPARPQERGEGPLGLPLAGLRMPAFALDGPYRNYRAFGLHVEAIVGHTHLRGYPGQSPELLSESLASDGIAGVQGALTVMMALRHRERTGKGQMIEMPLTEGFLPTLGEFIMDYTMNGRDTPTQGNRHPWHAPHNVYPCQGDDNWIAIDVGTDDEFAALCQALDGPHVAEEARFNSPQARLAHVEALDEALSALTRDRDKEQLFHQLQAAGVCATPVRRATDVLEDPQLQTRGFFEALPTADEQRSYLYPGLMFRMARTPNALRSGPARLGEHNREIYCDLLGYTPEELTALEEKGLVGEAFPPEVWRPA